MAISSNTTGLRPGVCTSTTRPTAPYEGQMIYTTDLDTLEIWTGSAWQVTFTAAASPVPFRYQVGTVTFANTVTVTFVSGRFTQAPMVVSQPKSIGSNVAYEFTNVPSTTSFNIERSVTGTYSSQYIAIQATSGNTKK
jgi:hypothetical protein